MAEPLGVAFVEIEPVAAGFRAKTEAQLRTQLAGVGAGIPPSPQTAQSTKQLQTFTLAATEAAAAERVLADTTGGLAASTQGLAASTDSLVAANAGSVSSTTAVTEATIRLEAARTAALGTGEALAAAELHETGVVTNLALATETSTNAVLTDISAKEALIGVTHQATTAAAAELAAVESVTAATLGEAGAAADDAVAQSALAASEERAAAATILHGQAAKATAGHLLTESAAATGLKGVLSAGNIQLAIAAAAAIALFKSAELADQFAEQMHLIEAATHATAEELDSARNKAFALGHDLKLPGTSALESAEAINLLVRSGFDLEEAMTAARGALLLEAASGDGAEESVRQLDRILDAFNLTAEDSVRVADAVATGLKFTQGSAQEFSQALSTLAPAADSLGLSLESTNTLVLQLAESGLSTSAAAGSLRQAFLKLAAGGKGVNDGLARIDLTMADLRDEFGRLRPDAFVILADAMKGLRRETQLQILTQIFSRRAALGVIRIIEQQREGFDKMSEKARESGGALEEARARSESFGGQLGELKSDLSDTGTAFGGLVQGPLTLFVKQIRGLVQVVGGVAFGILVIADTIGELAQKAEDAVPFLGDVLDILIKIEQFQAAPATGLAAAFDFIKDIPDKLGDAGEGLANTLNSAAAGLKGIPGAEGIAADLAKLARQFDTTRGDVKKSADGMADDVDNALTKTEDSIKKHTGRIGSLGAQLAVAIATGTEGDQLGILRQQKAQQEAALRRKQASFKAGDIDEQAVINQANQLASTNAAIASILAGQASDTAQAAADAEAKAKEIETAADKRDQAFIAAQQALIGNREGAVRAASATDPLGDDLRANARLRDALTKEIAATQARIIQVRAAGRETEDLAKQLATLRQQKNAVRREIDALQQQARDQAAATRVEQSQLDLQIAEAKIGDDPTKKQTATLVSAHQRVINALKKQQALTKKRSVEYKRLQLEIEQEKAAIRDLKKASKADDTKTGRTFSQEAFAFMQTLTGFSSNLASNLIPGGATGGLVGGSTLPKPPSTSAVGSPFAPKPGGATVRPVTTAQGNTQIDLLRKIHVELRKYNGGQEHPEATKQRVRGTSVMDLHVQGTMGM